VEALEDVEMILITNEQLQELARTDAAISANAGFIKSGATIANNKRMQLQSVLTAEERYEDLARRILIFSAFPQNMIAHISYFAGDVAELENGC